MKENEDLYAILELNKDCTNKEIKTAFIRLSKKYHPDVNSGPDSQTKFQKINQAYNILIKPVSRYAYDSNIKPGAYSNYDIYRQKSGESFWENRSKYEPIRERPYYGIKGLKKVPNSVIVFLCIIFAATGVGLQIFAIRKSFTFSRDKLNEESAKNAKILEDARKRAQETTMEEQIQKLIDFEKTKR